MTDEKQDVHVTKLDDTKREQRTQTPPLADPRTMITDPASGPVVYFDHAPVYAVGFGVASITVTTQRQILDAHGRVTEDRIITDLLRAPLPIMLQLRAVIDDIERLANQQAAAIAAEAAAPSGLPN